MKREHAEALAALFDGERVDPPVIDGALEDPEAPAMLADLAGLRALAQEDVGRPGEDFYAAMAPIIRARRERHWWRWFARPALAASLLLLGGLSGFYLRPAPQARLQAGTPRPPSGIEVPHPSAGTALGRGWETAAAPGAASSAGPGVQAGAPPAASLRLRFSQWQPHASGATAQPQ